MDSSNTEVTTTASTEPLVGEVMPNQNTISVLYVSLINKQKHWDVEREKKKKNDKKKGDRKSKKDVGLEQYDDHFNNFHVLSPNRLDPFMREQSCLREGNVIPEELKLGLYDESGFFFGMKNERNVFIGKPAHQEGHLLIAGVPGSGKTMAIVIPTMMTWRGIQIIIDVKGDL